MLRSLRAIWRLGRVLVHILHGVWVAWREFDGASAAHRCARIQWWSAKLLALLGLRLRPDGRFAPGAHLIAANHVSWLDITAVHAVCPQARFVSKADVKAWPVLGWLIAAAGTIFIERESKRDALRVVHQSAEALAAGDTVAFFPEGTTSDGHHLLPFHANLLQAALDAGAPVQPVGLRFLDGIGGATSDAPSFVGDESFLGSVWRTLKAPGITAVVHFGAPERALGRDRRAWSQALHAAVDALRHG